MLKFFVKTEIGQRSRIHKMQDMYANSNKVMIFKLVESPPKLGLICFKTFDLNLI